MSLRAGVVLALLAASLGCRQARQPPELAAMPTPAGSPPISARAAREAPAAGRVAGIVRYAGRTPLKVRELTNTIDVETCGARVRSGTVIAGANGVLANVFVQVLDPEGRPLAVDASTTPPEQRAPVGPVRVDIARCDHVPHVAIVPLGADVEVGSEDGILHELVTESIRNEPFEVHLPRYKRRAVVPAESIHRPETVKVTCTTHPWMVGWWIVTATPHRHLTGADGTFAIADVPPGAWRIHAWHEDLGEIEQELVVPPGGEVHLELLYR